MEQSPKESKTEIRNLTSKEHLTSLIVSFHKW